MGIVNELHEQFGAVAPKVSGNSPRETVVDILGGRIRVARRSERKRKREWLRRSRRRWSELVNLVERNKVELIPHAV